MFRSFPSSGLTQIIQTTDGPIRGIAREGMRQYLGIPYAAPPVGGLRWRPPQNHMTWTAPYEAIGFGNVGAQGNTSFPGFGHFSESEDCLYLNVFTPEDAEEGMDCPVMVWIPGGGLFMGSGNSYDPSLLVKNGKVIFVSVNYRLNIFGFFSHPAINAEEHACGNYGIMDQQCALGWVRRNIEKFGGDPANVTIFGESAGGISVWSQVASPGAAELFHKAIVLSGSVAPTTDTPTVESKEHVGQALMTAAGCSNQTADNLRLVPTADLLKANAVPLGTFGSGPFHVGLMMDGKVIPKPMKTLFSSGEFNRVPIMNGTCRDEFYWFQGLAELATGHTVTVEAYADALEMSFKVIPPELLGVSPNVGALAEVLERYPPHKFKSPSSALAAAIGDCGLICNGGRRVTRMIKKYVNEVYAFEFNVPDSPSPWPMASFPYESAHTIELQYLFPGFRGGSGISQELTEVQKRLANQMVHYWTTFSRFGTPNDPVLQAPFWPVYDREQDNYLSLQTPTPVAMTSFGTHHHCDFWDTLADD